MNTTQKVAKLKELDRNDRETIYKRLSIAAEVMLDHEWIDRTFDGSEIAAAQFLESQCFSVLSGTYSLESLLRVYRHFPAEDDWKRYKYNLNAMMLVYRESISDDDGKPEPRERANWHQRYMELREELIQLKLENAELRVLIAESGAKEEVGA